MKLDAVIHERVRLAIISALAVNEELSFNDLKKLLEITDGNLSVHARKLEDAGYVKCSKSFVGRQPRTTFKLTAAGRRALEEIPEADGVGDPVGAQELVESNPEGGNAMDVPADQSRQRQSRYSFCH